MNRFLSVFFFVLALAFVGVLGGFGLVFIVLGDLDAFLCFFLGLIPAAPIIDWLANKSVDYNLAADDEKFIKFMKKYK